MLHAVKKGRLCGVEFVPAAFCITTFLQSVLIIAAWIFFIHKMICSSYDGMFLSSSGLVSRRSPVNAT